MVCLPDMEAIMTQFDRWTQEDLDKYEAKRSQELSSMYAVTSKWSEGKYAGEKVSARPHKPLPRSSILRPATKVAITGKEVTVLFLPLPPSLNHSYITTRSGKRIMTAQYRKYKIDTIELIKDTLSLGTRKTPFAKLSLIQYRFFLPDNRRRDLPDNYGKGIRDCLKGTLVEDDCWQCIAEEHFLAGGIDKSRPRVEIRWNPEGTE